MSHIFLDIGNPVSRVLTRQTHFSDPKRQVSWWRIPFRPNRQIVEDYWEQRLLSLQLQGFKDTNRQRNEFLRSGYEIWDLLVVDWILSVYSISISISNFHCMFAINHKKVKLHVHINPLGSSIPKRILNWMLKEGH